MVRAMAHPLVDQLRFTRTEWLRALRGVPEEDGLRRLEPMNSIGWIVAHLAWQEQRYFLTRAQDVTPVPLLNEVAPNGGPPTTPSLRGMLTAWRVVTGSVDPWLDTLTTSRLSDALGGTGPQRTVADSIQRVTYHYWFHVGEILAIRQLLGHPRRPEFVGDIDGRAPWRPDRG
jgi:DinB superfamily